MTEQISSLNKTTTMTTSDPTSSQLLQEARSVDTCAERLQELNRSDPGLGPQIASNPSAPIELLDQLALQCPTEVLANPVLQFRDLETGGGAYGKFSLRSLVCLCLVCDPKRDAHLLAEMRRRIRTGLDELRGKEWIRLTCVWLYKRTFTLGPDDCDGLIDQPLELTLELRAYVDGYASDLSSAIPSLAETDTTPDHLRRSQLAKFLESIATGDLGQFIDSCIDPDGEREHKGSTDILLRATNLPDHYSIKGNTLCKAVGEPEEHDAPLLAFDAEILEFDFVHCQNGVVSVAVGEPEEIDREYDLPLGDLKPFELFVPHVVGLPLDWPARLSALLIP
jgi:hypothetical protein